MSFYEEYSKQVDNLFARAWKEHINSFEDDILSDQII